MFIIHNTGGCKVIGWELKKTIPPFLKSYIWVHKPALEIAALFPSAASSTDEEMSDNRLLYVLFLFLINSNGIHAQQVVDTAYRLPSFTPAYAPDAGPTVLLDLHHHNFSVKEGNYDPFISILEKDGYKVKRNNEEFSAERLEVGDLLVIINAIAPENSNNWSLPVSPAFSEKEIKAVYEWVEQGGSLLLVADHMPFPEAAAGLGRKFGLQFMNGFAIDSVQWDPLLFKRSNATLSDHPITRGRNTEEQIDSVASFWGQAIQIMTEKQEGLLWFGKDVVSYNPDTAWRFRQDTPVIPVTGMCQGAAGSVGKGRVVVLGEAGMLTAQRTGPRAIPVGINSAIAKQNVQFILNVFHWLSFLLPPR